MQASADGKPGSHQAAIAHATPLSTLPPAMPFRLLPATRTRHEDRLQQTITLLHEQIAVLRRLLDEHHIPIRATDIERHAVAERAHAIGWAHALAHCCIATGSTVRGWWRRLVCAAKATPRAAAKRKPGRPPIPRKTRKLVCRVAIDNPTWGYDRLADQLGELGITISDTTVGTILREHHLGTAPERSRHRRRWRAFIAAHWPSIASCDFLSVPVGFFFNRHTCRVLLVMHLASRRVHSALVHPHPDGVIMANVARNLTMDTIGFLSANGIRYLIRDRDLQFPPAFDRILTDAGITVIQTPVKAPNANAHIERFNGSIRRECLDHLTFLGEAALRHTVNVYLDHYHRERVHQGIGHRIIEPRPSAGQKTGRIRRRTELGGLLSFYERVPERHAA